jgi:uncharacterized protein (TIGR02118 family)
MIKLVYCITKRANLTDEEFFHYWKNVHGPIGAKIPGLRRLVQNHRLTVPGDKYTSDFDGVAELWFDDVESLLRARQSPEWRVSSEDESNFVEPGKVSYLVAQERVIVD